jgi:hypothetical protein
MVRRIPKHPAEASPYIERHFTAETKVTITSIMNGADTADTALPPHPREVIRPAQPGQPTVKSGRGPLYNAVNTFLRRVAQ